MWVNDIMRRFSLLLFVMFNLVLIFEKFKDKNKDVMWIFD